MKYLIIILSLFLCTSCLQDKRNIQKSIHITCNGDTIITYGGHLNDYTDSKWNLYDATH